MVELLSVILIVAVLGSVALASMLDFRNEGRAAALMITLNAMRVGMNNQAQKAMLRCGRSYSDIYGAHPTLGWEFVVGHGRGWGRAFHALQYNDSTYIGTNPAPVATDPGAYDLYVMCYPDQIPELAERKFTDFEGKGALLYNPDNGHFQEFPIPENPFVNKAPIVARTQRAMPVGYTHSKQFGISVCDAASLYMLSGTVFSYLFNIADLKIHAATNTPGINECNL